MAYHRKSAPPQGKRPDGTYGDLIPVSDEDGARLLKNNRPAIEFLRDTMHVWDKIPDVYFRPFWRKVFDYAENFNREEEPFQDWGTNAIYELTCNQLDIYADKWLDSWQKKSRGGKNSAAGRMKKGEEKSTSNLTQISCNQKRNPTSADKVAESISVSENQPPPKKHIPDAILSDAIRQTGKETKQILQEYAKSNGLHVPSDTTCEIFRKHVTSFSAWSISEIISELETIEDRGDDVEQCLKTIERMVNPQ